jgi:cytochrome c5
VLAAVLLPACGDFGGESGSTETAAPQQLTNGAGGVASVNAFSTTVHPLLVTNCQTCHAGAGPGSPHIALGDAEAAFHQVLDQGKVRLSDPASSRLVRRLVTDRHHCWSDCSADGAVMQAAIEQWADLIDFGSGGVSVGETLASTALTLGDGIQDVGSERYSDHLIAFYEFKEGSGNVALDTSGVDPAMDLVLQGDGVEWLTSYGLEFSSGQAIADAATSSKLFDRIADLDSGTGQYTVEAWVQAASTDQEGPARIISYSRGTGQRNFTLGQVLYNWDFRNRTISPEISGNGTPALQTYDGDQDLQDRLRAASTWTPPTPTTWTSSSPGASGTGIPRTASCWATRPREIVRGWARSAWWPSTSRRSPSPRSCRTTRPAWASGCSCASTCPAGRVREA